MRDTVKQLLPDSSENSAMYAGFKEFVSRIESISLHARTSCDTGLHGKKEALCGNQIVAVRRMGKEARLG